MPRDAGPYIYLYQCYITIEQSNNHEFVRQSLNLKGTQKSFGTESLQNISLIPSQEMSFSIWVVMFNMLFLSTSSTTQIHYNIAR